LQPSLCQSTKTKDFTMSGARSGAVSMMVRKSKDKRQQESLLAAFKRADLNGDGLLTAEEYYHILADHGVECSRDEIKEILRLADQDHDGFISREEFMDEPPKRPDPKSAEGAFKVFDMNHDGFVTKDEMLKLCKHLNKEQVDKLFESKDKNHDEKLSRKEFADFLNDRGKK